MLVKKYISILFVFSLFYSFSIFAQQKVEDSLQIQYFTGSQPFFYKNSDTTLSNLIFYQPNSSFTNFAINSGNIGQAFVPLSFNLNRSNENVFKAFDGYIVTSDSVRYYHTSKPYSEFNYTQGLTKEHLPSVFHTQRFNEQMGVTLNYRVISSEGTYNRQISRGQNLFTTIDFHSKSGHFLSLFDLVYNSLNIQENGGITKDSDTAFATGEEVNNRLLLATNLNSASNLMKHRGASWKNYWFLFGKEDSLLKRSNRSGIFCDANVSSSSSIFKITDKDDVLNPVFNSVLIDSTQTRDSLWVNKFETFAGFTVGKWKNTFYIPQIKLGYKQQWFNVNSMNSAFVAGEFTKIKDSLYLCAKGHYGLFGRRANDIKFDASIIKALKKGNYFSVQVFYGNQKPSFFDNYFISNHHYWKNDFKNIQDINVSAKFHFAPLRLSVEGGFQNVSNYIFFDIDSNLVQVNDDQFISYASIFHNFQNKWFRSRTFVKYQSSSYAIRIPSLLCRQEIAFLINRKAIHAEIGLMATYISNYFGNAYDPSTRDYYLQNIYQVGGVTLVDLFASLRVGSAKLYFKADHLNAGFMGYNYVLVPYHPLTDRTFKLGIRWTFWS